jgi:hypothetical protein
MKEGAPLQSVDTATTMRVRGGYYILECENLDEALTYAAKIPAAAFGSIEVRPVLEM